VVSGNPSTWSLTSLTEVQIPQSDAATVGAMSGYPLHYAALAQVTCSSSTKCDAFGGDSSGSPFFALGQPSSWNSSGTQLVAPFASVQKAYFGAVGCYQSSCYTVGSATDGIFLAALPN
jgi:hypothetical protein